MLNSFACPAGIMITTRLGAVFVLGAALAPIVTAQTTQVTLRIFDQNGALIPGSQFSVFGGSFGVTVPQDTSVAIPEGTYTSRLFPGLAGQTQGFALFRDETLVVAGATQTVDYVWPTASLDVTIVNQSLVPIAGSQSTVTHQHGIVTLPNGSAIVLPVTYDPAAPPIQGLLADGYGARLFPGLAGQTQGGTLFRDEPAGELTAGGASRTYTWPTAPITITIEDQFLAPIPGSQFFLTPVTLPNGSTIDLPVTDDPAAPPLQGSLASGYGARLFPGLAGQTQGSTLFRDEPAHELGFGGLDLSFVWPTAPYIVTLVDQASLPVAGSQNVVVDTPFANGSMIVLPVTDDPSAPPLQGIYAAGYGVRSFPSFNGMTQGFLLYRDIAPFELSILGASPPIVWEYVSSTVHAVDASEIEIASSTIRLHPVGAFATGSTVSLPVNDDAFYADLGGPLAGAYPIEVEFSPGTGFAGPFSMELLTGGAVIPPFVNAGSTTFGIRFGLQPVTDLDGDGYPVPADCDDSNPTVHPGAPDLPGDALDQDCDGAVVCDPGATWKNHGQFVSCVAQAAQALVDAGLITTDQKDALVEAAAQSNVGKKT